MITASSEKTAYEEALEKAYQSQSQDVNEWLNQTRETAFERFHELKFPTKKNEAWKYANLNPLLKNEFVPAEKSDKYDFGLQYVESHYLISHSIRKTFINGLPAPEFDSKEPLPDGVQLTALSEVLSKNPGKVQPELTAGLKEENNPFASINTFSFRDGVYFSVDKDVSVAEPVHLFFIGDSSQKLIADYPRILVCLNEGAKADLLFDSLGLSTIGRFTNAVVEIHLKRNARLNLILLQREQEKSFQFLTTRIRLEEGSRFDSVSYSRGGEIIRNEIEVDFQGEQAHADLKFLSVLSEKTKNYNHVTVNHKVPHCTSRQLSKNILADKAQAEFNSLVSVFRDAQKSDSDQLNRNLLLSDSARAYSRPQLKIDADDVTCAHGAATGQLVGDELFYLRSRGIEKKLASFILSYSFADEVLDAISLDEVRSTLENEVHKELDDILEDVEPENIGVV